MKTALADTPGRVSPSSDLFDVGGRAPTPGRMTRAERARYCRRYYAANKEKLKAKAIRYYAANREKAKANSAAYRALNAEKLREQRRAWRAVPENKQKRTLAYIKHAYGLDADQLRRLQSEQGGACAICGTRTSKLDVDHNHQTGAVRGLLCGHCNKGLGLFRDDPKTLRSAARYAALHQRRSQ